MKKIQLIHSPYVTLVDDEDYLWLSMYGWHLVKSPCTDYAACSTFYPTKIHRRASMHRAILIHHGLLERYSKLLVDHKDGDGLNNQKSNIRPATKYQNAINRRTHPGSF